MSEMLAFLFGLVAVVSLTANGFFVGVTMSEEPKGVHPETIKQNRRIEDLANQLKKLERKHTWLQEQVEHSGVLDLENHRPLDDTDSKERIRSLSQQVQGLRRGK